MKHTFGHNIFYGTIMLSIIPYQLLLLLILMSYGDQAYGDIGYSIRTTSDFNNPNQSTTLAVTTTTVSAHLDDNGSSKGDIIDGPSQGSLCAYYDDHPSASAKRIDLSKRFYRTDGKTSGSGDGFAGVYFPGNSSVLCASYCFTLWVADPRNKSRVTVSKQGCWIISEGKECQYNNCISNLPPRQNNTHFCCCSGYMCNNKFQDVYNPAEHTTTTTHVSPVAFGPLHDHNYKKKTIIIALVSVVSVSLLIMFFYLTYRLCLTSKPSSPQSSSVARVETPEPLLPEFNVDDLKIQDVLVRGRYSEIRKGWLRDTEVAVKLYQPHHRQYYCNERNAFTQPFMDHENLVKFFGAKEQEDPETNLLQYIIVTQYIPLGSLTSYLKHNTVDWYMLCHMCQGISRGLAHLHTDIQKGDLFKPAIAHRDLNTRNILVKPDLTCVIADLGFSVGMIGSKIIKNGVAENAEQATLADVGTLRYMAPEVFDGAVNLRDCEASLKQIDVYALGLVIWEIASRCVDLYQGAPVPEYQLPFQAEAGPHPTFEEIQVLVVKYKTRPRFPEVWKDANPAVRSLKETIEDCWDSDAEARLTSLCVQERIVDMAALWVHGTKHRGVTPTLNATMNLSENSQNIHSGSAVVSNGVTYLPSYVDRNNETNEEAGELRQREEVTSPVIPTSLSCREGNKALTVAYNDDTGVTAPLISNVGHLGNSDSFDSEEGRLRSWLQDQSMSGSTMDTMLPPTPLEEANGVFDVPNPVTQPLDHPPIKASNVMIAINKAVILHPNQGRNPTVERNTHKRSDEELTVSGNVLIGPGNQVTNSENNHNNRRGSLGARSAPPNRNGDSGSFDGTDAVESSFLVQNDSLGQYHTRPRNMPIPYFQNHVHGENIGGVTVAPYLVRPKLANIAGNRSSYLRLQGEDASHTPHTASVQTSMKVETKSLKHKLGKLIRPKDFGIKFSQIVFGGMYKKNQKSHITANTSDVESVAGRNEDAIRISGQYINSGLDASPVNRNMANISCTTPGPVAMEVQIINGSVVTRACNDTKTNSPLSSQNGSVIMDPQGRLSATNVMRLGVLANPCHEELPSPSLFPKSGGNSVMNDSSCLSSTDQEHAVPLQNLVAARLNTDYGSMHPVILNQAYGIDGDTEVSGISLKIPGLSLCAVDGIQDTSVASDHPHSAKVGSSNSSLDLTSLNLVNNYPSMSTLNEASLVSDNSVNCNLSTTSNVASTEQSLVSLSDPHILNTVIQSPQNKTINPLNKPLHVSLLVGHSPKMVVKKYPKDTSEGIHSGQNPTNCPRLKDHHTDTKGGNSIMHNIQMETNKNLSKDTSRLTNCSAKKSAQLLLTKSPPPKTFTDGVKFSEAKRGNTTEGATEFSHNKFHTSGEDISPSQSVTDLTRHQSQLVKVNDTRNDPVTKRIDEKDTSNSSAFIMKPRPKSLSLKGHNYNRSRGRSASSSSLSSASSLPQTTETFLQIIRGLKTSDENGPQTSVVPSVKLDKSSMLIQNSTSTDEKLATPPTNAAVSTMMKTGSCDASNSVVKNSTGNSRINTDVCSGSSNKHQRDDTKYPCGTTTASKTSSKTGHSALSTLTDQSDSSEKIRRRIKTPVSFKKSRLSLYDDRLMTQSLGFVSLSDVDGTSIVTGSGDSNNNSSGGDLCSQSGVGSRRRDGSTAQISRTDYNKMIKSESDLVV